MSAVEPGGGCDLGLVVGDLGVPLVGDLDVPLLVDHGVGLCATLAFLRWLPSKGIWYM